MLKENLESFFFSEVRPLKAAVVSSETADNSQQLNVVPKLMVQIIDFRQTTPHIHWKSILKVLSTLP